MTLLELIVAITISAIAMTAGYAAFATIIDRRKQVTEATGEIARSAAARRSLEDWLSGAHLTLEDNGPSFRGVDGERERLPDDEITFLTNAPTPLGASETIVRLYVVHDTAASDRGLVAELSAWEGSDGATEHLVIDRHVVSLNAEYLSGLIGARKWLPSWISSSVLPAGVRLSLGAARGDTLAPLLGLPVVVAIRGGQ
jgi:prepilin-type N-terminal cleavage/methylation domain-containing protein